MHIRWTESTEQQLTAPLRALAAVAASSPRQQSSHADLATWGWGTETDGALALAFPLLSFERGRGIRGGQAATMMAAAALRPHKASPARVPTRCVAALCATCFLLGVCVVNRSVRLLPPNPPHRLSSQIQVPRPLPGLPRPAAFACPPQSVLRQCSSVPRSGSGGNWSTFLCFFAGTGLFLSIPAAQTR